jgi:ABC-type multidrug transport system fused ATPase/permease subunit
MVCRGTWAALIYLSVSVYALYMLLGQAAVVGISILIGIWPLSIFIARRVKTSMLKIQKMKDQRSQAMSEVLKQMRIVKAFNWQSFVFFVVNIYRTEELRSVLVYQVVVGILQLLTAISQLVAPVATIAYYALADKGDLTASVVFTSLAWFSYLQRGLGFLPSALACYFECSASLNRLDDFFDAPERSYDTNWSEYLSTSALAGPHGHRSRSVNYSVGHSNGAGRTSDDSNSDYRRTGDDGGYDDGDGYDDEYGYESGTRFLPGYWDTADDDEDEEYTFNRDLHNTLLAGGSPTSGDSNPLSIDTFSGAGGGSLISLDLNLEFGHLGAGKFKTVGEIAKVVLLGASFSWGTSTYEANGGSRNNSTNSASSLDSLQRLADAKARSKDGSRSSSVDEESAPLTRPIDPTAFMEPMLRDIDMAVVQGQLVFIVGKVATGKSSLLLSIMGETIAMEGTHVDVLGTTAFVSEKPWMTNSTIKQNILFGRDMDLGWYMTVLNACCLSRDLALMPLGDETEIGQGGVNLSGGQRARVNLARGLYARPDIFLLDDVFSALVSSMSSSAASHRTTTVFMRRVFY